MKIRYFSVIVLIISIMTVYGCMGKGNHDDNGGKDSQVANSPIDVTPVATEPTPETTPTLEPTPAATENISAKASLGFVGDIMMMQVQVKNAKNDSGYDFTRSFAPMQMLFEAVDIMCANLETPLAGEKAKYSGPAPTVPPATDDNPNPTRPFQTFNAPDELAYNLKDLGVDVLTTANNHCLDRGMEGLYRTLDVIRKAGFYQTGTYKNEQERNTMCIIDVNGIRVGILAYSAGFNLFDRALTSEQLLSISKFYDESFVKSQIMQMRAEGAEYIVVEPHCGTELSLVPENVHKEMFRRFIKWGADAIISSHPHVVQPIEFVEISRDDGTIVNAPIVYSLGNFISNMAPAPKTYGLYVRLDIERDQDGIVTTKQLEYTPVYCIRQSTRAGLIHQTLPCGVNVADITAYESLSTTELEECQACRDFVVEVCGTEYLSDN